jgi:hypothetical protein
MPKAQKTSVEYKIDASSINVNCPDILVLEFHSSYKSSKAVNIDFCRTSVCV